MCIEIVATEPAAQGVQARHFRLTAGGRRVPGTLWQPAALAPADRPLVLLQHGGSGHRTDRPTVEAAIRLARDAGFCSAAIDGPVHGDRREDGRAGPDVQREFVAAWSAGNGKSSFVDDWLAVIQELATLPGIDARRMGWFGLSMGTAFGMSVLGRCPALRAAVLGKWSGNFPNSGHLFHEARRIRCPVLFIQHWNDEFFDQPGTFALFDAIRSDDKRLHIYPGPHAGRNEEELAACVSHLSRALALPTAPAHPN